MCIGGLGISTQSQRSSSLQSEKWHYVVQQISLSLPQVNSQVAPLWVSGNAWAILMIRSCVNKKEEDYLNMRTFYCMYRTVKPPPIELQCVQLTAMEVRWLSVSFCPHTLEMWGRRHHLSSCWWLWGLWASFELILGGAEVISAPNMQIWLMPSSKAIQHGKGWLSWWVQK